MRSGSDLAALFLAGAIPCLAFLALGLWLLRALRAPVHGAERLAFGFALGSGASSLAILLLRALDVPTPLWALGALALVGLPLHRERATTALRPPARAGRARAIDGASVVLGVLLFVAALAPETTWDGFEYHLPLAMAFAEGPIRALPGVLDAEFRAGVDLLYIPAVSAGVPDAAAAVSAAFAMALAALVRAEASRRASPTAGSIAGFFTLAVPFTLTSAPTTYVDLAVGTYGFLALLLADRWNRTGDGRWLTLAALFLAFAANAKLHAAILVPAVLVLVAAGGRAFPAALVARCAALVAVLTLPWFVKTGLSTGNPLFPLFGAWLGYGPSSAEHLAWKRGDVYYYVHVERSVTGFFRYLASLTFGHTYHVSGLLGPLPLALAPLAWHRPTRATGVLVSVVAALALLQFLFMPALRFGAPLLPFVAIAAAIGAIRLAHSGEAARTALATGLVVAALLALSSAAAELFPRLPALRDPQTYERAIMPAQDGLRTAVARAEPVVAIPRGAVAWMPKPVYVLHWSRNGELFFDGRTPAGEALALLRTRGVRSLVIDAPPGGVRRVGHPIVDAWLADGRARLRPDPRPPTAQKGRVWRVVDLDG